MLTEVYNFVAERAPELWLRTGEHLKLTGISTGIAIAIGVPLGILADRVPILRSPLLSSVSIIQTVPSLAMLAILLAVLGMIGTIPAIIALTFYALLPIVRNTLSGLSGVSPEIKEAARGMGMTGFQQLRMVQIPLALPIIVAGIRTAAVIGVGIATLSAFIGAGGLGQFINRGLALADTSLILLGAIPAALLALLVDFSIGAAEWGLSPTRQRDRGSFKSRLKPAALLLPIVLIVAGAAVTLAPREKSIRIGTKNFTEQFVLGELMLQMIENRTDLRASRVYLGGTTICHQSLINGEIDLYVEYTGTALTAILDHEQMTDPQEVLNYVREKYSRKYDVIWLEPLGFNSTYAITVRQKDAEQQGLESISDLAPMASRLEAGFTSEFAERPDGYPGLKRIYGFEFGSVMDMEENMMYQAIAGGEVDVISAFITSGKIDEYDLHPLKDDRHLFPPYDACPLIRAGVLDRHPEIRDALQPLIGQLDVETVRRLNHQTEQGVPAAKVARRYLSKEGLLIAK